MYIFKEDFSVKNDKNIPYSLAEQNIHPYSNPSAVVENNKLLFTRECARLFLKTPFLNHFKFKCQIGFTSPASAFNKYAGWGFFFGYNPDNHTGNQLKLSYFEKTSTLKIQLYEVTGKKSVLISESVYENLKLHSEEMYNFSLSVEENKCFGNAFGICFSFQCNNTRGKIGISNESSTNGLYFSELIVESSDVDYTIVTDKEFVIPYYDGGSEDYCIHIIVKKYTGGTYELSYTLTGGVYSRNTKDYKRNIWSVQYDIIRNAYIKFYGNPGTDKLFLKNGELRFVEQNETYKDTELALNGEKMPFAGKFRFEEFDENADFAFGYELFRRLGNELQEGRREYVYRNGNLIYSGTPLYEDYIITVQSPANKKIATLIPKNIDKYENALFHAQSNHYFMHDEPVTFKVTTHIRKDCELTKLNITLLDAFFDEIQSVEYSSTPTEKFYEYGFTTFEHNINLGEMTQEVYHIKAEILLGDVVVCKHISAFEVIDNSKLSPRQSSKIPFIYSGEAAPPNIEFNCPDPWMIKPDHNEAHYIDCLLTVPEVAENRNGWDIMKLYKKTMFTWINNRTIPHKKTYRDYPNCLKNSDYARIQPLEAVELVSYITNPSIFTKPTVLEIYQDFKNEHKDYVLPDISENGRISTEDFTEFYKTHGSEWIEYLCNKNTDNLIAEYQKLKKEYPDLKFSHYGPYAMYGTKHSGILSSKLRLILPERAHEMMDGFWYFEDYPFITGQASHYSGWNMMGLLMYMPKANIVVELFGSFDPVCPDGFVSNAFPPMGGVFAESYRTVTQVYEHMYAAIYKDGNFHYYNNPGFQFLQSYNTEASLRFEEFLKGWGTYLKNKPAKPMKSAVFVTEYTTDDDRFNFEFSSRDANNISQAGMSYLYEIMAEAGLPKGYCTNFEGVLSLDETQTDVCVLPSLKYASKAVKDKIRALSKSGVSLIATSDISDLNDLFGVLENKCTSKVAAIESQSESECVTIRDAEFFYKSNGADVILNAITKDGKKLPFILKNGKNIIINSYICHVGCAEFAHDSFGIANISKLLRKTATDIVKEISTPLATADANCGINLFVTESGKKRILLTDFTLCGHSSSKRVVVKLNMNVKDIKCVCHKDMAITPNLIKKDGKVIAFTVTLRPGESTMFAVE